ncbi:uncharacterized protein LOC143211299 [Lasioglossum baleicum]|uniref:uncharacterized protein LOC143211299 n=1 Tax=Lasioglossum baleicum TaxID=434251 RepID=UPI003FCD76BD
MDKRSRYSASIRDRVPSVVAGESARSSKENFATEFLKYCEEYNVTPLPQLVARSTVDVRLLRTSFEQSTENALAPIFYLTYEGKKQDAPKTIESKDKYLHSRF